MVRKHVVERKRQKEVDEFVGLKKGFRLKKFGDLMMWMTVNAFDLFVGKWDFQIEDFLATGLEKKKVWFCQHFVWVFCYITRSWGEWVIAFNNYAQGDRGPMYFSVELESN